MLDDKQNDIVFNLDIRFEHNATHAVFVVQKSEKYSESVIRDVALASGRGNRAVLDAGQVFLLLWLTAVAGNWKHVFIVPAILIGSLAAHLLGQTFAHAEEDDKRRLLISILAPR